MTRAAGVLAAALLAMLAAAVTPATNATGQEPASPDHPAGLSLHIDAVQGEFDAEGALRIRARVTNAGGADRSDLRVLTTVHRPPIARWEYQEFLDRGELDHLLHAWPVDLDPVPARGERTVELTQTAAELGLASPSGQEGLYPIQLQLLAGGEVADEVVTSVVLRPEAVPQPLHVSLIVPLAMPPARDAGGVITDEALLDAVRPDGFLASTLAAVADADMPVTVAVDPVTIDDVRALASGVPVRTAAGETVDVERGDAPAAHAASFLARLRDLARDPTVDLLPLPYAGADLVALTRHGPDGESERRMSEAPAALERVTGARPVQQLLWPPDGLDDATAEVARAVGVDTVLLDEQYLRLPSRANLSPSPVRLLRTSGGTTLTALVPDPWLETALRDDTRPPTERALRILGELAAVFFEQPATSGRGVLLAPATPDRRVDPALVTALSEGIEASELLRPVRLRALAQVVDPESATLRLDYPQTSRFAELPTDYLAALGEARRALRSLSGVLEADAATLERFEQMLLQAPSTAYRGAGRTRGRHLVDEVARTVADLYRSVEVLETPPVTLTNVEGEIPVTLRSHADVPLRVRLTLLSPRYRVEGGPVRDLTLPPGETQILVFAVRDMTPGGTSPIQVVISDADGQIDLAVGTVVVRSTAVSVAALIVTAAAGLILFGGVIRAVLARRRRAGGGAVPSRTAPPDVSADAPADGQVRARSGTPP